MNFPTHWNRRDLIKDAMKKISSLFLLILVFNLNTLSPIASHRFQEACGCPKENVQTSSDTGWTLPTGSGTVITCEIPQGQDNLDVPALGMPFLLAELNIPAPSIYLSDLPIKENLFHGITPKTSDKPPMV